MHHLQAVLQSRPRPPPGFSDPDAAKPLVLQPGSKAVWVGANYFGAVATVLADPAAKITGKSNQGAYYVRVQVRMWGVCLFVGKGVCVCGCECCVGGCVRGGVLADPAAKITVKPVILEEQSGGILCAGAGAWWVVCKLWGGGGSGGVCVVDADIDLSTSRLLWMPLEGLSQAMH
jgi:hypothetical protein